MSNAAKIIAELGTLPAEYRAYRYEEIDQEGNKKPTSIKVSAGECNDTVIVVAIDAESVVQTIKDAINHHVTHRLMSYWA